MKLSKNDLDHLYEDGKYHYKNARGELWRAITSKSDEDSIEAFEVALTNINALMKCFMDTYTILEDEYTEVMIKENTID